MNDEYANTMLLIKQTDDPTVRPLVLKRVSHELKRVPSMAARPDSLGRKFGDIEISGELEFDYACVDKEVMDAKYDLEMYLFDEKEDTYIKFRIGNVTLVSQNNSTFGFIAEGPIIPWTRTTKPARREAKIVMTYDFLHKLMSGEFKCSGAHMAVGKKYVNFDDGVEILRVKDMPSHGAFTIFLKGEGFDKCAPRMDAPEVHYLPCQKYDGPPPCQFREDCPIQIDTRGWCTGESSLSGVATSNDKFRAASWKTREAGLKD